MRRRFASGLAVLALLITVAINCYTLAQVVRARTRVPWVDQWVPIQDLERVQAGESVLKIVWAPYWGHRLVIPRLFFLADARWLSFASLTWLTLLFQFLNIALLVAMAWVLLGRKLPALFVAAVAVILNLMLSPLQMENFVWGMQTMFTLVLVAATGAFLCLAAGRLGLCLVLGIISSLTMPNGLLVWPVLVAQSLYLKQGRRATAILAAAGTVIIGFYLWHYTRPPELGLGVGGMMRHPVDAVLLLGLIIGSPFRFTVPMATAWGLAALIAAGYVCWRAGWPRRPEQRVVSALLAILLFSILSALSLVAGRLTPSVLHAQTRDPLPGRYFTLICFLWAGTGLMVLYAFCAGRLGWAAASVYGVAFAGLMFAGYQQQLIAADDWADFFLGTDATGGALILKAHDEPLLSILWPAPAELWERTEFLRVRRLGVFHEPRAAWPGRLATELYPFTSDECSGGIEKTVRVDENSWRVQGWAWDSAAAEAPHDILIADSDGRVIGLGRGGLRHGYIPGLMVEAGPVPASHSRFRRSEWLGYVRAGGEFPWDSARIYGVSKSGGFAGLGSRRRVTTCLAPRSEH